MIQKEGRSRLINGRVTKAVYFANMISKIPFVRGVSLTGSLAQGLSNLNSDIDFFVKVSKGRLYLTRLWVTAVIHLTGYRRHATKVSGRVCLNWFATFDGPLTQGRNHLVLSGETVWPTKQKLESILSGRLGDRLESLAEKIQIWRFSHDRRTHLPDSQVRFSQTELGFHPPKVRFNSNN